MIEILEREILDAYDKMVRAIELNQLELASKYQKLIEELKQQIQQ